MSVKSGIKKNRNQVAMSALTLSLLAAYMAPAHALTTINDDVNVTGYAQIGTTTTSSTASTGAGSGSTPPPPSTNNGNGTTTLYNISAYGASNVSSTSTTGGVLAEPSGNITGTGGSTTTTSSTWDVASYIIVASSNVSQVLTTGNSFINMMNSTATVAGEGGNLIMSGNGSFGGNLYVDGTIIGGSNATGTPTLGDLVLKGGTNSTTVTLSDAGMQVQTTGTQYGGGGIIHAQDDLILNADSDSIGYGGVVMQKNGTTLLSVGTGYSSNIDAYTTLDMHGNNIANVGTITATTGNITTINSTTINNSGTFNNTGNANINGNLDVNGTTNLDGAVTMGSTLNVAGATTLNGSTTVNNNFTVDTNGASGNVTGTGRVVVSNNTAVVGVQNAGGGLNGITSNSTQTVVSGGTGTSTLTLQQNSAVLDTNAGSSVNLSSNDANMYGYTESGVSNAYGSSIYVNGNNAYVTGNSNAYVYGYYNAEMYNAYGSGFEANQGNAYMTGSSQAVVTGGSSSMRLDSDGATFSGEGGSPIRVHGVADGKAQKDAVNVSQLESQRDSLSGGIASIAAIANIPHVDPKKTFAVGIGYGNYDGQSGYAVGGSYRFMEDGILKASVAGSDDGETAWGVGAGFSW